MKVTIPSKMQHGGFIGNLITIEIANTCPVCGGPRGDTFKTHSYDGSRRLNCDGWLNPCSHIDKYSAVRKEAVKQEGKGQKMANDIEDQFIELLQSELCYQVNAASLYAELMYHKPGNAGWTKVNRAIIDKWSKSGLEKVKTMAWQLVEGSHLRLRQDKDEVIK